MNDTHCVVSLIQYNLSVKRCLKILLKASEIF